MVPSKYRANASGSGGDERLGRLLKDVLRHKAKDTPYSISPDGWMTIDDALSYVNSFGFEYDEPAIRQEVWRHRTPLLAAPLADPSKLRPPPHPTRDSDQRRVDLSAL